MSQIKDKENRQYWRSLDQLEESSEFERFSHREFQEGASELKDGVSRRSFLKLMGASAALAGVAGCGIRKPVSHIRPYVKRPEYHIPGKSLYYATSLQQGEDVLGVLAESHEGRPTKLEGNPDHPASLGRLMSTHQAMILDLYDPDRVMYPLRDGKQADSEEIETLFASLRSELEFGNGEGVCILTDTQLSPTFYRLATEMKRRYPKVAMYRYEPLNQDSIVDGVRLATGRNVSLDYRFDNADIVVSFASDFLGAEPGAVSKSRAFSDRRDPSNPKGMNRLYVCESHFSITGGKADHRIRCKASEVEAFAWVLSSELFRRLGSSLVPASIVNQVRKMAAVYKSRFDTAMVDAIVSDLLSHRRRSILIGGASQSSSLHALLHVMNRALGNISSTVLYRTLPYASHRLNRWSSSESIDRLAADLEKGDVKTLLILGGNPVYASPSSLNLKSLFEKTESVIHLTVSPNETSAVANWVIPQTHFLEQWGDLKTLNGAVSLVQPLIRPLYDGVSVIECLSRLLGKGVSSYQLVRDTWRRQYRSILSGAQFESAWKEWVHKGVLWGDVRTVSVSFLRDSFIIRALRNRLASISSHEDWEVMLSPDSRVYDGRFSNNGWLQETPDPISKLTWDNAAFISQRSAKALGVSGGDLITVASNSGNLTIPVMVMPGHADYSLTISLGYGREHVGRVGEGTGFNAYPLLSNKGQMIVENISVSKASGSYVLATTQNHGALDGGSQIGRPLVREADTSYFKDHPDFAKHAVHMQPADSLWEEKKYDTGNQWGMTIDLTRCTSCNACLTACQAENNIPIVGKSEVLQGREMHWIRVDRYFEGDVDEPTVAIQPMNCLQCENAPCEQVCPVGATVHSEEGLNDMVYNRCIGTRYCSNNCPVKVRRFNFFDYHQRNPQSVKKDRVHLFDYFREPEKTVQYQFNPDVTVRMRGVMEKCTYCIQRISKARIDAKREKQPIQDGQIVTACQQTCPSNAIVFGDLRDPKSKVAKLKKLQREYFILDELYLKARTTYLALIRNPHPSLKTTKGGHHEYGH